MLSQILKYVQQSDRRMFLSIFGLANNDLVYKANIDLVYIANNDLVYICRKN